MNQKGFTLIETILVLAVLSIMTIIASQIIVKINERKEVEHFFNQLQLDVLAIQSYSVENHYAYITFITSDDATIYRAVSSYGNVLFERKIPGSIQFYGGTTNLKKIEFVSGQIRNFGTLYFVHEKKNISFIFYIERGRTRIVES